MLHFGSFKRYFSKFINLIHYINLLLTNDSNIGSRRLPESNWRTTSSGFWVATRQAQTITLVINEVGQCAVSGGLTSGAIKLINPELKKLAVVVKRAFITSPMKENVPNVGTV